MLAEMLTLQFLTTFTIFLASAGGAIFINVRSNKPRTSLSPPLVAPTSLMVVLFAVALFALIHMLSILGLHK